MKLVVTIITSTLMSIALSGQDLKVIEVESNQQLNLSVAKTWNRVNDWENLHELVPAVVESTTVHGNGQDSWWQINLTNGGTITEKMVYYNSNEKTVSYVMTETPMPIQDYTAIIKVEPYGITKSQISFYTTCKTSTENYDNIKSAFKGFQETYLSNIEKLNK